jgi:3',5'-cyclic AMP phosphodiesterase CpdA
LLGLSVELQPEVVIATGDLTHRNRPEQHAQAAAFLHSLGAHVIAIPGNHDMPMLPPARFARTFAEFGRAWSTTEPTYRSERVVVCGLNSARPWLYQEGAVRRSQLAGVAEAFQKAPAGALRVAALHHHLIAAPWRTAKLPLLRRNSVLAALLDAGADLIVSGHVHQSCVVERREFDAAGRFARAATVAVAPGLGRPRPGRRGEAQGFHVYEATEASLRVLTYAWAGEAWERIAERRFGRDLDGG